MDPFGQIVPDLRIAHLLKHLLVFCSALSRVIGIYLLCCFEISVAKGLLPSGYPGQIFPHIYPVFCIRQQFLLESVILLYPGLVRKHFISF